MVPRLRSRLGSQKASARPEMQQGQYTPWPRLCQAKRTRAAEPRMATASASALASSVGATTAA